MNPLDHCSLSPPGLLASTSGPLCSFFTPQCGQGRESKEDKMLETLVFTKKNKTFQLQKIMLLSLLLHCADLLVFNTVGSIKTNSVFTQKIFSLEFEKRRGRFKLLWDWSSFHPHQSKHSWLFSLHVLSKSIGLKHHRAKKTTISTKQNVICSFIHAIHSFLTYILDSELCNSDTGIKSQT